MLFIHGENDTFVPFSMLDEVYNATQGPKEKYVVPGAEHAKAYNKNPEKYKETVAAFLDKYIKYQIYSLLIVAKTKDLFLS